MVENNNAVSMPTSISLKEASNKISALLKERQPCSIDGISEELHPLPPFVAKGDWSALGDAIKSAEQPTVTHVPGEKWISLRCDGTGFSKLTKQLVKEGVLCSGYSEDFGSLMTACCQELITKFNAKCGYTQSDELTVLIPPCSIIRGEQQAHAYNGRLQKMCSLAAATVTAKFHFELMILCHKKGINAVSILQHCSPTFDCRLGAYVTEQEALSLILWRAYDCGINAVSDTVYKSGIEGAKQVLKFGTQEKLPWLKEHNLLPLPSHQREGSFWVKRKRILHYKEEKTGEQVAYLRRRMEQVEGNVLQLYKDGALFPPDDVLESKN